MAKVRDMDKTITGFLFHPYFLYGLLLLIVFAASVFGAIYLFKSDEPMVLRLFGGAVILFGGSEGLYNGIKNIKTAWKDWTDYRKE